MDILHSLACAVVAVVVATPICFACLSTGFTGVAALAGGLFVMSLVGGES